MARFLVLFLAPTAVIDDWKKTDPAVRKPAEEAMRADWDAWMGEHAHAISGTEAAGRTKRVTADRIADARNDLMLSCFVEADTPEAAAALFARHPHLRIPQASIEVTEVRSIGGPQS